MITLQIDKHQINIPNESKEINLTTGIQILELISKKDLTLKEKILVIHTISGIDVTLVNQFTEESINNIFNNLNFLKDNSEALFVYKSFKLNGIEYGLMNFDNMTVLEYSDIEFYLTESEFNLQNLNKILTILYRPIINKKQTLKNILINKASDILFRGLKPRYFDSYEIEEYIEVKNEELFSNSISLALGLGCFSLLMQHRDKLSRDYYQLFNTEKIPEEDKDQYDPEEMHQKPTKSFEQVWGMFHCVKLLSNGIFEEEHWYKKKITEFFKAFTYYNAKINHENMLIKQNNQY